mmetsp:Transcript_17743/g.28847  ORF Transcript_17743/g.28847 Transcript_17743/m.28847 type:complete len:303 (-) Transcript_17743:258-1166(-)
MAAVAPKDIAPAILNDNQTRSSAAHGDRVEQRAQAGAVPAEAVGQRPGAPALARGQRPRQLLHVPVRQDVALVDELGLVAQALQGVHVAVRGLGPGGGGGAGAAATAGAKPSHSDMDPLEGLRHKAELIDQSNILSDGHVEELAGALPAGERGRPWALAYSLRRDGACLRTLLYAVSVRRRASCLIVIEDSWGYVFGGYCGHRLENKQGYYGTGQSFVFGFHPAFRAFGWTGKNDLFAVSNESQLAMGGGGGFAFSLDGELDNGVSNRSETYGNPRLSSNEFFKCLNVEVWVFEEMAFGGAL